MLALTKRAMVGLPALVGTGLAVTLARITPAGAPYDEPAHWANVLFYAEHRRMPVLGEPTAHYEAQMGPGYYAPSAVLVEASGLGASADSFALTRLWWIFLVPVLAFLTFRIARELGAANMPAAAAAAIVGVNPLMLAIASSIQNDYAMFVVVAAAILIGIRLFRRQDASLWAFVGLGALIGVAVLTKVVAIALLAAVVATNLLQRELKMRHRLSQAVAVTTGAMAVSGWWFIRNLHLYGDLTGANGMARLGIHFPPVELDSLGTVTQWLGSVVSYVFVPVEYYRNALEAPGATKILAALATVAVFAVLLRRLAVHLRSSSRARTVVARPERLFAVNVMAMTLIAYLVYCLFIWWIPVRLLFLAAPLAAAVFAMAARSRWAGVVLAGLLTLFIAVDGWLVMALAQLPRQAYWIF